jgi:hypothetical protein
VSASEPPPPSGSSLLARLGWAVKDRLFGRGDEQRAFDAVKLVHADDLRRWERFPRCQEFDGITYGHYRAEVRRLELVRRSVASLIQAGEELEHLDTDAVVEDQSETVEIPRRALLRRTVRRPLPSAPRPGTWVEPSEGVVHGDTLEVDAGWRRSWVVLSYKGPSRVVHAEQIDELRRTLAAMSAEQRAAIDEVATSRYRQPVLFISHRWENEDNPDRDGSQLRQLQALEDCFIVYDYTSFPQAPRTESEQADFEEILGAMDELVNNVVILDAPDYLTRGWCVYEYVVASLRGATVCDEVGDERFVALRDWAGTPPPVTLAFRDSNESQQQNYISEQLLHALNEVLPLYRAAEFQTQRDQDIVSRLLLDHLKSRLAPIKESQEHFGEWKTTHWTDEMLEPFFAGRGEVPSLESAIAIRRFRSSVPSTIEDAVQRRYKIERFPLWQLLNPLDTIIRTDIKAMFTRRRHGA